MPSQTVLAIEANLRAFFRDRPCCPVMPDEQRMALSTASCVASITASYRGLMNGSAMN